MFEVERFGNAGAHVSGPVLVVLKVFLDESRPGETGRWDVFSVGGVLMEGERLSRFDREWNRALRFAPAPLDRFHMTDWEARQGGYRGWSERDRLRLFDELCTVISRSSAFAVSCSIDVRAYDALPMEERLLLGSTRYAICFQSCFAQINAWRRAEARADPVEYVLDQTPPKGVAGELPELRRLFWEEQISSMSFDDSRRVPGLQAADLLVYEMAKQAAHELGRRAQTHQRRSLQALLEKAPQLASGHGVLDAAGLRSVIDDVRQGKARLPTKRSRRPLNPKHFL